jgi:hypothetical protein
MVDLWQPELQHLPPKMEQSNCYQMNHQAFEDVLELNCHAFADVLAVVEPELPCFRLLCNPRYNVYYVLWEVNYQASRFVSDVISLWSSSLYIC